MLADLDSCPLPPEYSDTVMRKVSANGGTKLVEFPAGETRSRIEIIGE